jgi:hypothetical protein
LSLERSACSSLSSSLSSRPPIPTNSKSQDLVISVVALLRRRRAGFSPRAASSPLGSRIQRVVSRFCSRVEATVATCRQNSPSHLFKAGGLTSSVAGRLHRHAPCTLGCLSLPPLRAHHWIDGHVGTSSFPSTHHECCAFSFFLPSGSACLLIPLVSSPMPIHAPLLASCFLLRRSWSGNDTDDDGEGVGLLRRA